MNHETPSSSLHILLIEDSEDDYLVVKHVFDRMNLSHEPQKFDVHWMDNYEDGRRELLKGAYEIALIDYHLGSRSGVELLLDVRAQDCYVPIIILTGQGKRDIDIESMRAGAAEYLRKDDLNESLLEHVVRYAPAHGRSEAALRESVWQSRDLATKSNLLAVAVSNLADGVIITDPRQNDNPIIFANAAFCTLTGYQSFEILGCNCRFLQGPETSQDDVRRMHEAIELQRSYSGIILNYHKDGTVFWNGLKISPVFDENGQLINFVGIQADVTQRKMAEENVRFQARLLDTVGQAVIATDLDGVVSYMNRFAEKLYGWSEQEAIGRTILSLIIPEVSRNQAKEVFKKLKLGEAWAGDMVVQNRAGAVFAIAINNAPIFDDAGNLIGLIGVSEDITQRKLDEQALRESQTRFQRIVANTPGMVYQFLLRPDGSFVFPFVSEGCRELLEWEPAFVENNPAMEILVVDGAERLEYNRSVAASAATLQPWKWEGRIQVPSGKTKWVQGSSRPQRLPDGSILWDGLLMDVTERKRAETVLAGHSHALEMVARGVPLTDTLDHLCHLMEKRLEGAKCSVLLLDAEKRRLLFGAGPSVPTHYNQAIDGIEIGPRVGSCGTAAFTRRAVLVNDIETSALWTEYAELALEHGLKACWSNPIFDATHNILGTFAVYFDEVRHSDADAWHFIEQATDIAAIAIERQKAEALLLQSNDDLERRVAERTAQLERAKEEAEKASLRADQLRREADEANSAKSEFLSRMSHELRTPLNAILGFGQILEMCDLGARENEGVEQILRGGRHLLNLINEVLDIARVEAGSLGLIIQPVAVGEVIGEICALVKPLATERNVLLQDFPPLAAPHYVLADVQKLKQVLLNLLSNAIKYNRPQGTVAVSVEPTSHGALRISVRDSGPGIAPHDLSKLFTPFERLGAVHSSIEGTGLGLVLSRRLVEAMNGSLQVESSLERGSSFSFELPVTQTGQGEALPVAPGVVQSEPVQGSYSLLCIEDNLSNLRLIETIMEARPNVSLLAAMQGSVGFDLAQQHHPDLILLDLNLPDIDGKDLLGRLKNHPTTSSIPVVVISADATPRQIQTVTKLGAHVYLTKPLDVALFLRTVDDILQTENAV